MADNWLVDGARPRARTCGKRCASAYIQEVEVLVDVVQFGFQNIFELFELGEDSWSARQEELPPFLALHYEDQDPESLLFILCDELKVVEFFIVLGVEIDQYIRRDYVHSLCVPDFGVELCVRFQELVDLFDVVFLLEKLRVNRFGALDVLVD